MDIRGEVGFRHPSIHDRTCGVCSLFYPGAGSQAQELEAGGVAAGSTYMLATESLKKVLGRSLVDIEERDGG